MKPALATETPPACVPWIPALLWLGIIALESTDLLSATHTLSLVHRVLALASGYLMSFTGRGSTLLNVYDSEEAAIKSLLSNRRA